MARINELSLTERNKRKNKKYPKYLKGKPGAVSYIGGEGGTDRAISNAESQPLRKAPVRVEPRPSVAIITPKSDGYLAAKAILEQRQQ
jgi:hypothetical protein